MINRVYKTKNGLTMVESWPYHWQKESIYYVDIGPFSTGPYHYHMSINPVGFGENGELFCSYTDEDKILSVNGKIKIKVSSLEEAGEIVEKMIIGMELEDQVRGTIYEITEENTSDIEFIRVK